MHLNTIDPAKFTDTFNLISMLIHVKYNYISMSGS